MKQLPSCWIEHGVWMIKMSYFKACIYCSLHLIHTHTPKKKQIIFLSSQELSVIHTTFYYQIVGFMSSLDYFMALFSFFLCHILPCHSSCLLHVLIHYIFFVPASPLYRCIYVWMNISLKPYHAHSTQYLN